MAANKQEEREKLKMLMGDLLHGGNQDEDEEEEGEGEGEGKGDAGFRMDQQSKPYLSRMDSFRKDAYSKKNATTTTSMFGEDNLDEIEGGESDAFSGSPKFQYLDSKKKSQSVFVGMGFGSVIGYDEDEGSSKGGLFDDVEEEDVKTVVKKKTFTSSRPMRDYATDLFGDKDIMGSEKTLDAGLDKLMEGKSSQKSVFAFGTGILSEQELIRSHVASHRTKEEIATILALVPPETMSYDEFISKFAPHTEMLASTMRFINSIIGPNGDGLAPITAKGWREKNPIDYIFYGTNHLDERCKQFFDDMQQNFLKLPSFYGETEERIMGARDCFEQYVMERIASFAFKFVEVTEDDDQLMRRMKVLSFLTIEALDIKPEYYNEVLLQEATEQLRRINSFRTPGEKVDCVVDCVTTVFKSLSASSQNEKIAEQTGDGENEQQLAGADDFLPIFIWVVLRSNIPKLCSNCAFIETFLNPARMISKAGYCLINLRSAINFVNYVDPSSISIDRAYFEEQVALREKELDGNP